MQASAVRSTRFVRSRHGSFAFRPGDSAEVTSEYVPGELVGSSGPDELVDSADRRHTQRKPSLLKTKKSLVNGILVEPKDAARRAGIDSWRA